MGFHSLDKLLLRLGLPKRAEGSKPNGWSPAEDAYILEHYIRGGETAEAVGRHLGRTRVAVIGRAHRQGWTRRHMAGIAA